MSNLLLEPDDCCDDCGGPLYSITDGSQGREPGVPAYCRACGGPK